MKHEKFKVTPLERAWILYDVGNSAFVLMIATLVPIFFNALAEAGGLSPVNYLAYWGYASSVVTVVTAVLGPILGTLADTKNFKKPIFMLCLFVGVLGCCAMGAARTWLPFLVIFIVAKIGFSGSLVFYDSMLGDVTTPERMDMVSSRGYAWGYIGSCVPFVVCLALVLGSGLGGFAEALDVVCEVPYSDIPGFPVSTVPGHAGKFIFGHLDGVPVVCMQGRIHYYEGYELSDVVLPARLMHLLGAEILFLTNASGGVNPEFDAGDFMLMTDHIMLFFPNPLVGPNIEELGTRFPDMSHVYDPELCEVIRSVAKEAGIALREGVYCQLTGPCFETPAEVRMLGVLGADAVGMSTAVEATAARHCGMRVCGISCVCNKGAGLSPTPLTHEEVQAAADAAAPLFKRLVKESIVKMCR